MSRYETALIDEVTAAHAAKVKPATIRWWVHKGYLPVQRTARGNRFYLADVLDAVDRPTKGPTP